MLLLLLLLLLLLPRDAIKPTRMFLTRTELMDLTGKARPTAQARALQQMGVEHLRRPDGSIAVLRCHIDKLLGGGVGLTTRKKTEPDFSMVT